MKVLVTRWVTMWLENEKVRQWIVRYAFPLYNPPPFVPSSWFIVTRPMTNEVPEECEELILEMTQDTESLDESDLELNVDREGSSEVCFPVAFPPSILFGL